MDTHKPRNIWYLKKIAVNILKDRKNINNIATLLSKRFDRNTSTESLALQDHTRNPKVVFIIVPPNDIEIRCLWL